MMLNKGDLIVRDVESQYGYHVSWWEDVKQMHQISDNEIFVFQDLQGVACAVVVSMKDQNISLRTDPRLWKRAPVLTRELEDYM